MKLTEKDRNDIFGKNGKIKKLGSFWIGFDITFGIHIPTHTKEEAKQILSEIMQNQKKAEKWDSQKYNDRI